MSSHKYPKYSESIPHPHFDVPNDPYKVLMDDNYLAFAAHVYDNPQCEDRNEFEDDLKRVHYVKKLLNKYVSTGELKERLILNHITLLHNVFGIQPAAKMLFFKLDPTLYPALKTFLVSKYALPAIINGVNTKGIELDQEIINTLRQL